MFLKGLDRSLIKVPECFITKHGRISFKHLLHPSPSAKNGKIFVAKGSVLGKLRPEVPAENVTADNS